MSDRLLDADEKYRKGYLDGYADAYGDVSCLKSNAFTGASESAKSAIMKFRAKVGGRYYPGYHEDMRDEVAKAILALKTTNPTKESTNENDHSSTHTSSPILPSKC